MYIFGDKKLDSDNSFLSVLSLPYLQNLFICFELISPTYYTQYKTKTDYYYLAEILLVCRNHMKNPQKSKEHKDYLESL